MEGWALIIFVGSSAYLQRRVRLALDGYMRSTSRSIVKVRGSNRIAVDGRVAEGYMGSVHGTCVLLVVRAIEQPSPRQKVIITPTT